MKMEKSSTDNKFSELKTKCEENIRGRMQVGSSFRGVTVGSTTVTSRSSTVTDGSPNDKFIVGDKIDFGKNITTIQPNAERELMPSCLPFPDTIEEFTVLREQYKIDKERYYEFSSGPTSNKFWVSIITLDILINSIGRLKEVDLSTKQVDFPNATELLREENRNNVQLKNALYHNGVEYIESTYTKNIFVRNCDWNTLYTISNLVAELKCDLTVSGGGYGRYVMDSLKDAQLLLQETIDYHRGIIKSCPSDEPKQNVKVGIIDSGCSLSLYEKTLHEGRVVMHQSMIDAKKPRDRNEVPYQDVADHGTGVVEILTYCVVAKTQMYVAALGEEFEQSDVEAALIALSDRDCKIFNLSLTVKFNSDNLKSTIAKMKDKGAIFVAAAGNMEATIRIISDLKDNKTIMVGSHDFDNVISDFCSEKCEASVHAIGENVFIENFVPHVISGTSFATPHVTAVVSNFVSYSPQVINEMEVRQILAGSSKGLRCCCDTHRGRFVSNLRLDPAAFMLCLSRCPY